MSLSIAGLLEKGKGILSSLPTRKRTPLKSERRVGLNIGRSNVVACEVLIEGNQTVLERLALRGLQGGTPTSELVKQLWAEAGFQSKRVNIALKGRGIVIRFINFPRMTRSDFASSIQFEAEKYLPFSLSEIVFDYYLSEHAGDSREVSPTMPVILVAARKTEVERSVATVKEAGLEVNAIDVDTIAGANAFSRAVPGEKDHTVGLIDFGAVDTAVSILNKGALDFCRDIAFGGDDLTNIISRKLNIEKRVALEKLHASQFTTDLEQATVQEALDRLLHEVKQSINYYRERETASPLETLYISGGFSQFKSLTARLEAELQIPVKFWDPTADLIKGSEVDAEVVKKLAPFLPVSMGLALRPR